MPQSLVLTVTGMKCGGCESSVKSALQQLDGVANVQASHKENQVLVEFDATKLDADAIKQAITGAGFKVA